MKSWFIPFPRTLGRIIHKLPQRQFEFDHILHVVNHVSQFHASKSIFTKKDLLWHFTIQYCFWICLNPKTEIYLRIHILLFILVIQSIDIRKTNDWLMLNNIYQHQNFLLFFDTWSFILCTLITVEMHA